MLGSASRRLRRATPEPLPASPSLWDRPSSSLPSPTSPGVFSPASTRSRCTSTSLQRNVPLTQAWLPCSTPPIRISVGWHRAPGGWTLPAPPLVPPRDVAPFRRAARCGGLLGEREHVQRVGRLLRPSEGKRAVVYERVTRNTIEVGQARRRRQGLVTRRSAQV